MFDVLDKGRDAKRIAVRYEAFWLETQHWKSLASLEFCITLGLENEALSFEYSDD
jgi:hypothetical protein